jgi:hypothetical protein
MTTLTNGRDEVAGVATIHWSSVFEGIVRFIGAAIMLIGVVVVLQVMNQAWELYKDPNSVVAFSEKIENASNINKALNTLLGETLEDMRQRMNSLVNANNPNNQPGNPPRFEPWNISYFVAWFLKIVLILLIGRIGFFAMSEGGKLALVGMGEKNTAKNLAKEILQETSRWQTRSDVLEQVAKNVLQELHEASRSKGKHENDQS